MMGDRRRKVGGFGIGGRLASAVAVAVMAVAPVIASGAAHHLDGVALAIAEAFFGEPASAQECTDQNGDPRECTATEQNARCLLAADDAHSQCMDGVPWYGVPGCWAALAMDVMACTVDLIDDVLIPIG